MNKEDTEKAMDKIMLDKQLNEDLKIQSDEIIRLIEELKRVNRKASVMEYDNFRLIEEGDRLKEGLNNIKDGLTELDGFSYENNNGLKYLKKEINELLNKNK